MFKKLRAGWRRLDQVRSGSLHRQPRTIRPTLETSEHFATASPRYRTQLRMPALALGVWLAFFGLQSVLSAALAPNASESRAAIAQEDLMLAVLWAALSLGIAAWHRYARSIAPSLAALVALHLPMLV